MRALARAEQTGPLWPLAGLRIGLAMLALIVFTVASAPVCAALPGVTEIATPPESITDAELERLLGEPLASAHVVAIGESVHGSAGLLRIQTRLIRHLVTRHGLRLIVWENPSLRSIELAEWVASCGKARTPAPLDVLYMPTVADRPLWDWVCAFNARHPDDPIVFRGMDVWDRPWEHFRRIRTLTAAAGMDARLPKRIDATCPASAVVSWEDMQHVFAELAQHGRFQPEARFAACRSLLTELRERAERAGGAAVDARKRDAAFELAISASTLRGWLGFYNHQWSHDSLGWNERDRAQGRNLMLLMAKHRAARIVAGGLPLAPELGAVPQVPVLARRR